MNQLSVIKKDGSVQPWDFLKIQNAIQRSAEMISHKITGEELALFIDKLNLHLEKLAIKKIEVLNLHKIVEEALSESIPNVGISYVRYRNYKKTFSSSMKTLQVEADRVLQIGDRENANFDSSLTSTKSSLMRGILSSELYQNYQLPLKYKTAHDSGLIYIHDLRDLIFNSINCCLFDMGNVLHKGFVMSNLPYTEPNSALSALQVIGDVMLTSTAQQFGGFTVPDIDKIVLPYALKTIETASRKASERATKYNIDDSETYVKDYVNEVLNQELKQGFQSIEMKLNSVPSGRGDFAFTTLTFGNTDTAIDDETRTLQIKICEAILETRMAGCGVKQPVPFPKLVFLFNKKEYEAHDDYKDLFSLSIKCSSQAMYPDYLSVDSENGYVGQQYAATGLACQPMGCRAFLSPNSDDPEEVTFTGRANIGAVSLNLPMIWKESDGKNFYEHLDHFLQLIRDFHIQRFQDIAGNKCGTNPMAFCQGGLIGGTKEPHEKIGLDIVRHFTASFGITALNELNVLMEGKPLHESNGEKVHAVVDYISDKLEQFKKEDGFLYALYGTPAESLCGKQLKKFRERHGVIEGVSDREYFSNSFHMHVTADITPFEKQDLEIQYARKVKGGYIQYVRLTNPNNLDAIATVVLRALDMGLYFGVNFDLVICEQCSHRPNEQVSICPKCGSNQIMMLNRLCGYVGWGMFKGETRFNDSKLAEVRERISM
ncbi:anaerobic ribonucleoside-triphosphate reductase [Vibrio alginolyticus]|uniref:anaerobic ribonucleoside-triphosphate reductase n=1 Tax=Vibrio alginolyticus TaxID=663 RepID=UPI0006CA9CB7|nr:anaerobic ribonucleoside-triphosphate reductase [Vibrio alginolyticus]KPM97427.1 hypothetical protein AOG25_13180 [Vibrio alginolyticus]